MECVDEVDAKLHDELLTVMENRIHAESDYLNEVLPRCLDNIKVMWYETMRVPKEVFSVPEADSDVTL